jgi:hypothetical protein
MLENWNSVGLYQDILPEEDALEAELWKKAGTLG